MEKISETGIEKYIERIGSDGIVMNIRVETTSEGKRVNANVVRNDEKTEAQLIRECDGATLLTVRKDADLTVDEFKELFTKCGNVLANLCYVNDN